MTLTTSYFAPVTWYQQIARNGAMTYIEAHENYVKQSFRNRCQIVTANGVQTLTVPVSSSPVAADGNIRDIVISDHGNWRHVHWTALASAYGMSPFFDYYADDIRPFFEKKWKFLFDYNLEILHTLLPLLSIDTEVRLTDCYQKEDSINGAMSSLLQSSHCPVYYQTFQRRHGFIPNMSILDLLFNEGPEAARTLFNA